MRAGERTTAERSTNVLRVTREQRRELFSGPLPHPDLLIRYNEAHPGLADRIVNMAEKQQEHRQSLEKSVVESELAKSKIGLGLGLLFRW